MNKWVYMRTIASFMIALVLTLPFYSANSLAALQITQNAGKAGIEGFVDSKDDIWTLKVKAPAAASAERLKMNDFEFDSCSDSAGGKDCLYVFDYSGRSIVESEYPLHIVLFGEDGSTVEELDGRLAADGQGPRVSQVKAEQAGKEVKVSFVVQDKPDACIGVQRLEFFDGETSLKVVEEVKEGCEENLLEVLVPLSATGQKAIKIVATDRLGHTGTAMTPSFMLDNTAPVLGEFTLGKSAAFVPGKAISVPFSVEVTDESGKIAVKGTSSGIGMQDEGAVCVEVDPAERRFNCEWKEKSIDFSKGFSVVVTASDGNNQVSQTFSPTLTVDGTAPTLDFFGSKSVLGEVHYVKKDGNTFVARFTEEQSGMDSKSVVADFSEISSTGSRKKIADGCGSEDGKSWECVWKNVRAERTGMVHLLAAADNVGNPVSGLTFSRMVEFDEIAPVIGDVSVTPKAGKMENDFIQSKDILDIAFNVTEVNGVNAFVNITEIVTGTGTPPAQCKPVAGVGASAGGEAAGETKAEADKTAKNDAAPAGKKATEKAPSGVRFTCTLTTPKIKSGYIPEGKFTVIAKDTAGNKAEKTVAIEIFATDETEGDFWETGKVRCSPEGVDVNVMKLAPQRVFCSVPLETSVQDATVLSAQLVDCVPVKKVTKDKAVKEEKKPTTKMTAFAVVNVAAAGGDADAAEKPAKAEAAPKGKKTTEAEAPAAGKTVGAAKPAAPPKKPATLQESGISRAFLINNLFGSTNPIIVLELPPVSGQMEESTRPVDDITEAQKKKQEKGKAQKPDKEEKAEKSFECKLRLQTKRGTSIIQNFEEEVVPVHVKFFTTKFDKDLSTLDDMIKKEKDKLGSGFWGVIGTLNEIMAWVKIICSFISMVLLIWQAISIFMSTSDTVRGAPGGQAFATGMCTGGQAANQAIQQPIYKALETFCNLATCNPNLQEGDVSTDKSTGKTQITGLSDNWYSNYQRMILAYYNFYTFRFLIKPAGSLDENLPLSVAGLCLPGIIINLNKLRQVDCRYVGCLQNDVKAGVATIQSCRELRDYMECKYIWGELFQMMPFVGMINQLLEVLKSLITDPIGTARLLTVIGCTASCSYSSSATTVCNVLSWVWFAVDMVNSIVSAVNQVQTQTKGDYCKQVGV